MLLKYAKMTIIMQQKLYQPLATQLSEARLNAYRQRLPDADDLDVLAHYYWNVALSQALYVSLQAVEVALRNRLHAALTEIYRNERWFETTSTPQLTDWHQQEVERVIRKIMARDRRMFNIAAPHPPATGRIVAELSFGFWVGLLNKEYAENRHGLWRGDLIIRTFPHIPSDEPSTMRNRRIYRTRRALSVRFNRILSLRNRVFHHEPVWYWSDPPIQNLGEQHNDILETLRWMDPVLQKTVTHIDDFSQVYGEGPAPYRKMLDEILQTLADADGEAR